MTTEEMRAIYDRHQKEKDAALAAYAAEHAVFNVGDIVRHKTEGTLMKISRVFADSLSFPSIYYKGNKQKRNGDFGQLERSLYCIDNYELVDSANPLKL